MEKLNYIAKSEMRNNHSIENYVTPYMVLTSNEKHNFNKFGKFHRFG